MSLEQARLLQVYKYDRLYLNRDKVDNICKRHFQMHLYFDLNFSEVCFKGSNQQSTRFQMMAWYQTDNKPLMDSMTPLFTGAHINTGP